MDYLLFALMENIGNGKWPQTHIKKPIAKYKL